MNSEDANEDLAAKSEFLLADESLNT